MVDLYGKDGGNISLPQNLWSPDKNEMSSVDAENYPMILNMQITMYETLINDLNLKIERLTTRNEQLEKFCEMMRSDSGGRGTEVEKEIVKLNNNIAYETKKIDVIKKKYDELEKTRKQQRLNHLEKVNEMEEKFEKTRIEFHSEIKALNARINTMEDFKLVEENLRGKYDKQNQMLLDKEGKMQQELSLIDQKTKIHRENLKKEAYKQILHVSEQFQLELKDTIPQTVQRLMRQSIVLESELVRLWNDHSNMVEKKANHKDVVENYQKNIKEAKIRVSKQLITARIQQILSKRLKNAHSRVFKIVSKLFDPPKDFVQQYSSLMQGLKNPEFLSNEYKKRKLEVILHQERIRLTSINKHKLETEFILKKCSDVVSTLKRIVNSALMINKHPIQKYSSMDLETLATCILKAIEEWDAKLLVFESGSTETVLDSTNVYAVGDLGFEPDHIEIENKSEIERSHSESLKSTLQILKELEYLSKIDSEQQQRLAGRSSGDSSTSDLSSSMKGSKVSKSSSTSKIESKQKVEEILSIEFSDYEEDEYPYKIFNDEDYTD